jgi:uncharacterized membrane-anchored protein
MGLSPQLELWAEASVLNAGAATFASNSGNFLSVNRTAAGIVDVTLLPDHGVDATERAVLVTASNPGGVAAIASIDSTASTDTVLRVKTWDAAGAALDSGFSILIVRKRP